MPHATVIEAQAESLIELLAGQCADLEVLLALARSETAAVEQRDFGEMLRVTSERAAVGARLESYHRQIAELRQRLGETFEPALHSEAATRAVALVVEIQTQDARTGPLLIAARREAEEAGGRLNRARRGVGAYLRDARQVATTACDRLA